MADLVIASPAERDYAESLIWYAERSVRAAELFEAEFERALAAIAAEPERFPRCDDRHRYFLMQRYPFRGIYRIVGSIVTIIAVAHTSREPGFWSDR